REGSHVSQHSDRMPGTSSSEILGLPNSIRFERYDRGNAMRSLLLPTCCFISAPSAWICASRWLPKSWLGLEEQFLLLTRHTAFAISTTVTFWDSSTGQKIPAVRMRLMLRSLLKKALRLQAEATSLFRSTCTI